MNQLWINSGKMKWLWGFDPPGSGDFVIFDSGRVALLRTKLAVLLDYQFLFNEQSHCSHLVNFDSCNALYKGLKDHSKGISDPECSSIGSSLVCPCYTSVV